MAASTTQRLIGCLLLAACAAPAGCTSAGHLQLFGYTTEPLYDPGIQTVYVPIFENVSFRRGIEFDLTRAVIREIEAKTPYKVVNCREEAHTELHGKIINRNKSVILQNRLGEIREGEVNLAVELTWLDLRPGHIGEALTRPDVARDELRKLRERQNAAPGTVFAEEDRRDRVPRLDAAGKPLPVLVQPSATFIPELGGSVASAESQLVDRLAIQIVSMMERPW
jgi:hypothetical protein